MGKTSSSAGQRQWWERRDVRLLKGLLDLLIAYIFGSLAIDSGSYWHYLAAIIFAVIGLRYVVCAIRNKD